MRERTHVFAVLRFDCHLREVAPEVERVTVKEIVPTREEAEREVERLNALKASRHGSVKYTWQATRYFPDGRGSGT